MAAKREQMKLRRMALVQLLQQGLTLRQMAARLDCSLATIQRDIAAIMQPTVWCCPTCHAIHRRTEFHGIRRPLERKPRRPLMKLFSPASFA